MGTYSTTTTIEISAIGTTFDTLTTSMVSRCISWSEAEINKYLSKRYDVSAFDSLANTPPMVQTWCEWLSLSYLYMNNSRGGSDAMARGEAYKKMAIENLQAVAEYKLDLVDSAGAVVPDFSNTAYQVLSTTDQYTETFAEDNELQWKVDDDKLDDIDSDRD